MEGDGMHSSYEQAGDNRHATQASMPHDILLARHSNGVYPDSARIIVCLKCFKVSAYPTKKPGRKSNC